MRPLVWTPLPYEQRLRQDLHWALEEGERHFQGQSAAWQVKRTLVTHLERLGIPYALMGDLAAFYHGLRRFTDRVEVLLGHEADLRTLHQLGYVRVSPWVLTDPKCGVRVTLHQSGRKAGSQVRFPDPAQEGNTVELDQTLVLSLPLLLSLELAADGLQGGALAQEFVKVLGLPREFSEQLLPQVQERFLEVYPGLSAREP